MLFQTRHLLFFPGSAVFYEREPLRQRLPHQPHQGCRRVPV